MEEESLIRIAHLRYALAWRIFKILVSLENGHHQAVCRWGSPRGPVYEMSNATNTQRACLQNGQFWAIAEGAKPVAVPLWSVSGIVHVQIIWFQGGPLEMPYVLFQFQIC